PGGVSLDRHEKDLEHAEARVLEAIDTLCERGRRGTAEMQRELFAATPSLQSVAEDLGQLERNRRPAVERQLEDAPGDWLKGFFRQVVEHVSPGYTSRSIGHVSRMPDTAAVRTVAPAGLSLRRTTGADLEFLAEVYASTRQEELSVVRWTEEDKAAFLRWQFDL